MKRIIKWAYIPLALFFLYTVLLYKPIFFDNRVLLQTNFLVSFFAPWNTQKFPGWEGGIPFKPTGVDNLNLSFPLRDLASEIMRSRNFPLWNPYNFGGNVIAADSQSGIFYPLYLPFLLFPPLDAWNLSVMIQPILTALFTYFLLRLYRLSKPAALFGAVTWGFSARMVVWSYDHPTVSHSFLWLPLILWGIEGYLQKSHRKYLLGIMIGTVSSVFGGFLQMTMYVLAFSGLYACFRAIQLKRRKRLFVLFLFLVLSIGISAIHLTPAIEMYQLSPRAVGDVSYLYDTFLMPTRHLIAFFVPDYLGNPATYNFKGSGAYNESLLSVTVIGFLLALSTFFSVKNRHALFFLSKLNWMAGSFLIAQHKHARHDNKHIESDHSEIIKILWIITIISLLFSLNFPFVRSIYEAQIPILFTFLPSRIFMVTTFFLSVLSGFGFERWARKRNIHWILPIAVGVVILAATPTFSLPLRQVVRAFLFLGGMLGLTLFQKKLPVWILIIGCFSLLSIEQYSYAKKYLGFSYREFAHPTHPVLTELKKPGGIDRFFSYGDAHIAANFATEYRLFSPDGTDALLPSRLAELYEAANNKGQKPTNLPRIDIRIPEASQGEIMTDNPYRLRLIQLTGTRYVTNWSKNRKIQSQATKIFPEELFTKMWEEGDWSIYKYKDALPRFFLTDKYRVASSDEEALKLIYDPAFDLSELILETKPSLLPTMDPRLPPSSAGRRTSDGHGRWDDKIGLKDNIATLKKYEPNEVSFETTSKNPQLLFLSDTYMPGWIATIDGVETKILRAHYTYRAVSVPGGRHVITFLYEPQSLKVGILLSGVSVAGSLLVLGLIRRPGSQVRRFA